MIIVYLIMNTKGVSDMTEKNFTAFSFGLENGDNLIVPKEFIGALHIGARNGFDSLDGNKPYQIITDFAISIDRKFKPFWEEQSLVIRSVERIFDNGEEKTGLCYPLCGDDTLCDTAKLYNFLKINKHNDLFIGASIYGDLLDDIFPDEKINADNYTVFEFE